MPPSAQVYLPEAAKSGFSALTASTVTNVYFYALKIEQNKKSYSGVRREPAFAPVLGVVLGCFPLSSKATTVVTSV